MRNLLFNFFLCFNIILQDGEEAEPETAEEFDRLVLASPNSSLCW